MALPEFLATLLSQGETWMKMLENPKVLVYLGPIFIALLLIMYTTFVKIGENPLFIRRKKMLRHILLITRILIAALILIAIAAPFIITERMIQGDPFVRVLLDNSSSMQLYDIASGEALARRLTDKINTEIKYVGSKDSSDLGNGLLSHLKAGEHLIFISDGQVTDGANIGDVALYASRLNVTISTVHLPPTKEDAAVWVSGPAKTSEGVDTTFTVHVERTTPQMPVHVTVRIGDETLFDDTTRLDDIPITANLGQGYHHLIAEVSTDKDTLEQNNRYFKAIKVVPRPKVLLVTLDQSPPIATLLKQAYDLTITSELPATEEAYQPYYATVIDNVNANLIGQQQVQYLANYTLDGNGLLVIGGKNSLDKGNYKSSAVESILPVTIGTPSKEEGDINIVVLMDVSESAGRGEGGGIETAKALTVNLLRDLKPKHKVGVLAFSYAVYTISELGPLSEKTGLEEKIARVFGYGRTRMDAGIAKAIEMLGNAQGSKNLIIISDGLLHAPDVPVTTEIAKRAAAKGIKIYSIGSALCDARFLTAHPEVGSCTESFYNSRLDEDYLKLLADIGNGIYLRAASASRLKLLFGDVEPPKPGQQLGVVIMDENHFITEDLALPAQITGFNNVVPKATARLLLTTTTGDPLLTVWRSGLGKTAVLSTDDGSGWAGQLLNKENSLVITRTLNWLIGTTDRKARESVDVEDSSIGRPSMITVRSERRPALAGTSFYQIDPSTYTGTVSINTTGFHSILGADFATNYPLEYLGLGQSDALIDAIKATGGRVYEPDELDKIIQDTQSSTKRTAKVRDYVRWPFALAALALFTIELILRRVLRS